MTYRKSDLSSHPLAPLPGPEPDDRPRWEAVEMAGIAGWGAGWWVYDHVGRTYRPCQTREEAEAVCRERRRSED